MNLNFPRKPFETKLYRRLIPSPQIPASAAAVDVASPSTTHHQSPEIEMIDVMCDAEDVAMQVTIAFAQPFDGLIYSQGYFNQEKCR